MRSPESHSPLLKYDSTLKPGDDITAALQWAIDERWNRYGGGPVDLMGWQVEISGWVDVHPRIWIRGQGAATIVKLADGANGAFRSVGFDGLTGTDSGDGVHEMYFSDFTIDGNASGGATGTGIKHFGSTMFMHNMLIRDFTGDIASQEGFGIWTEWGTGPNAYGVLGGGQGNGRPLENRYWQNTVIDCLNGCIMMAGPHDSVILDLIAVQQYLDGSVAGGPTVHVAPGGAALQGSVWHMWGGDAAEHLRVDEGACRFNNIVAEGADDQIVIKSSGGVLMDTVHAFGQPGGAVQRGIVLEECGSAIITGKVSNCEGGALIFNGGPGGANGDFGNNDIKLVTTQNIAYPLFTGAPNIESRVSILAQNPNRTDGFVTLNGEDQRLGFFGGPPIAQQLPPASLADVIALINGHNLT